MKKEILNKKQGLFALKSVSKGLLISLIGYYAIVFFHLPNPIDIIEQQGWFSKAMYHYLAFVSLHSLIGGGYKFAALIGGRWFNGNKPDLKQSFLSLSIVLLGIGSVSISIYLLLRLTQNIISEEYWNDSHLFWVILIIFVLFGYFYIILHKFKLLTVEALDNLKTIPIVSPFFCFGGPFLSFKNIGFTNIPETELPIYYIISFSAGAMFLCFLISYSFLKSMNKTSQPKKVIHSIHYFSNKTNEAESFLLKLSYIFFGVGMYLLSILLFDISITMII